MKIFFMIIGAFLLTAAQVCGCGSCKANAQTPVKSITKDEPKIVRLKITGMTCAGCSNQITATLKELNGVIEHKVEYPGNLATVTYNPAKTSVADIIKAVEKLGFTAIAEAKAKQS